MLNNLNVLIKLFVSILNIQLYYKNVLQYVYTTKKPIFNA